MSIQQEMLKERLSDLLGEPSQVPQPTLRQLENLTRVSPASLLALLPPPSGKQTFNIIFSVGFHCFYRT